MTTKFWKPWQRVAFRFGFILAVLWIYPLPFGPVPHTEPVAELLSKPLDWLCDWFAESVLGVGVPMRQPTGSGDTLLAWVSFLVKSIVAALGAIVWSVLDRKRTAYPRLAVGIWVALRYVLAWTLLAYGFAKLFPSQFPAPSPARLDQRVGELSPMGLLWTFQGYSAAYTFFGGLSEAVAAVLLLWRRTATLGALLAAAVMVNIVMLNFCYDVPVKLYSSQLLCISLAIAAPQLRRVIRAILGYAVPESPPRARSSRRREWARLALKLAAFGLIAYSVQGRVSRGLQRYAPPSELHGVWKVEGWTEEGRDAPARWRKLGFSTRGAQILTDTEKRLPRRGTVIPAAQLITANPYPAEEPDAKAELWRYQRVAPERLVIERVEAGKRVRITLSREPEPPLVTRGFHWIQELPFNR